jgi:hypothetical protein
MKSEEITERLRRGLGVTRAEQGNPPPTCKEIAAMMGIDRRTVSGMNANTRIGIVVGVAEAMGVPVDRLLRYLIENQGEAQ